MSRTLDDHGEPVNWAVVGLLRARERALQIIETLDPDHHEAVYDDVRRMVIGIDRMLAEKYDRRAGPTCDEGHEMVAMESEGMAGPVEVWRCPACKRPETW